jgi:type IV pilus assembly protein PilY1
MMVIGLTVTACLLGSAAGPASANMCFSNDPDEIPPFLTTGVDPNLLMIIDNSASMFDLGYVGNAGHCYDESYDPSASYAGYFDMNTWYAYEGGKFVSKGAGDAAAICGAATHRKTSGGADNVCLNVTGGIFSSLTAKGNFFNWVAASKLDIEKGILTGGKYVADDSTLRMESRGCLERRFIKQTSFDFGGGYLTLAVRPPTDAEKSDAADNATRIELFPVRSSGYNHEACQQAVDEMRKESPNLGQLKVYIDDCMGYPAGGGNDPVTASRSAFNHSVTDCWYLAKQGWDQWEQTAGGSVSRVKNDCGRVYAYDPGPPENYNLHPWDIDPDHSGYICFGDHREDPTEPLSVRGYVGRCWNTGEASGVETCWYRECPDDPGDLLPAQKCIEGYVYQCSGNYNANQDTCNKEWVIIEECSGGGASGVVGWMSDQCIKQGLRDYCGTMDFPEVVDPSDQVTGVGDDTGEFWNLPAMLVDAGVLEQMGQPLVVMPATIAQSEPPTGLLQEFAPSLRIGAMTFNRDGAKSECAQPDPYVTYQCADPDILDGGRVIASIGKGVEHTQNLVNAINDIVADTWTPLAETMYNAIGYYTQDTGLRLNTEDFDIHGGNEPITDWCQMNNILLITDGASTADQNLDMEEFVKSLNYNLGSGRCEALHGSTYLDDLAYYAHHNLWDNYVFPPDEARQPITTHIVAVGKFRDEGADKCSPNVLLDAAAQSGGTELYQAETLNDLESRLREAFAKIRAGAASGSAASVISATRSGEGAVYQAIFWPEKTDLSGNTVHWAGEVHALFIDDQGRVFEDTNGNRKLDADDLRVTIFYDTTVGFSRACYGVIQDGACTGEVKEISEVKYLWSANDWLSGLSDDNITTNRAEAQFTTDAARRHIFTWYDLEGDGLVHQNTEILPFEAHTSAWWDNLTTSYNRFVHQDLGVSEVAEAQEIINWLRGMDQEGLRERKILMNGMERTWRLGDVVHSTPTAVSRPAEGYHLLYRDGSYARFVNRYNNRRHMIYFGGNDGMLHAVNGGFFDVNQKKFCLTPDCANEASALPLGAEVWAYVPYNLWPHLKCLADPDYGHKYYVDQVPRIFDVQIFTEEAVCESNLFDSQCVHPGGWGTILVGGMRFGGGKIEIDGRHFTSAYFILDVTNPEKPPRLLAEMTFTGSEAEMGFTTAVPTMVRMKPENGDSEWYLVLGSGPTTLKGESDQVGRAAVISLRELIAASNPAPFRIPSTPPTQETRPIGSFALEGHADSFVSDLITVDFDLNYLADAVYFGTVSGGFESNWGGSLYRLVTEKLNNAGQQVASEPHEWLLEPLIHVDQPVTAAPAVAWDGDNYWIYFGTGRLYNRLDFSDIAPQSYYGIKEPRDAYDKFTWGPVTLESLVQVDQIQVVGVDHPAYPGLTCLDGTSSCLPSGVESFEDLRNYIAGRPGWYREFHDSGERNLGQATVLGGLVNYTSYVPSDDLCKPDGFSYLYALYYQTGTAWHRSVFSKTTTYGLPVDYRVGIGPGLVVTPTLHASSADGTKVFLQTSTGAIVDIEQPELPLSGYKSGRESWRQIFR